MTKMSPLRNLKPKVPALDRQHKPRQRGGAAGGEGGIRTPGPRKESTVFKTVAFDRSATSPRWNPVYLANSACSVRGTNKI